MPNRYGSEVVSVRMFLVTLLVLVLSPWIFEVEVEAQKGTESCEMEGMINGSTLISRRSETCGVVKNITTIEECENGQWKEICDRNFTQEDAQVICRELGYSATRATAGYLNNQGVGSSTASSYPECNGQESSISECDHVPLSECNSPKVYVTCFEGNLVSGTPCNVVPAEPTSASPTTQLHTATSLASPPHTTNGTDSTDPTNSTSGTDSSIPDTNVGAPRSGPLGTTYTIIIIFIVVCIAAALFLFMAVMFAMIKYKKCKHSDTTNIHFKKRDPDESVVYSEVMDVPIEQRQQESCPIYETIMMVSVNTARIPSTDACPVDLKENIAYEAIKKIIT